MHYTTKKHFKLYKTIVFNQNLNISNGIFLYFTKEGPHDNTKTETDVGQAIFFIHITTKIQTVNIHQSIYIFVKYDLPFKFVYIIVCTSKDRYLLTYWLHPLRF